MGLVWFFLKTFQGFCLEVLKKGVRHALQLRWGVEFVSLGSLKAGLVSVKAGLVLKMGVRLAVASAFESLVRSKAGLVSSKAGWEVS